MSEVAGAAAAVQAGASLFNGIQQGDAAKAQSQFVQKQLKTNAALEDLAANQAQIEGNLQLQAADEDAQRKQGMIRAGFAAQGVNVNFGSANQVQDAESRAAGLNHEAIRQRVWQTVFGYKMQSQQDLLQAALSGKAGDTTANADYIGGGLAALGYGAKALDYFDEGGTAKVQPLYGN